MDIQAQKCQQLAHLHTKAAPFIIPNPWDVGSAKLLQNLGFNALATTSAGCAFSLGHGDGKLSFEDKLDYCGALAVATEVPVSVDFENGFADDPAMMVNNLSLLVETGVAGCSIEDFSRTKQKIYEFNHAVERIHAAADYLKTLSMPFQLVARAENLLRGVLDIDDTIRRLQAFSNAGADMLYAPGIRNLEDLKTITDQLDKPFNVLASFMPNNSVAEFAEAGAQRISLGASLTWACVKPLFEASDEMLQQGTFTWLKRCANGAEIAKLLS